jgi:glucose/arabinose dehydrogenase
VREVLPGGRGIRTVGTVPGVVHAGEGGLLGLAAPQAKSHTAADPRFVYAYLTTKADNRVVRMPLTGSTGHHRLGTPQPILTGIPKAEFHDGGRLAFGPDGMLYVTVGDAGASDNAQSVHSLSGKILRLTPTGGIPADNPFPGSPVYSLGHRNPQGIAWDSHGTLWASEFGQDTWDELNIITPGGNYGWPVVEGIGHNRLYIDPVHEWPTDQASPSGIAIVGDTIFMAGLGGQRLWTIGTTNGGTPVTVVSSTDALGRLRDVLVDSDDTLWLLTDNTDGRGSPRPGDDRIVKVRLSR